MDWFTLNGGEEFALCAALTDMASHVLASPADSVSIHKGYAIRDVAPMDASAAMVGTGYAQWDLHRSISFRLVSETLTHLLLN